MHVVFVRQLAYFFAMLLSGKISRKRGLRWSDTAKGTLCSTIKFATFTSARMTYNDNNNASESYIEAKMNLVLPDQKVDLRKKMRA